MTVPAKFSFPAALTHDQVEIGCSTTDGCAVTTRALMASLTQDSASLADAWNSYPEVFIELVENAPAAIERTEAILDLMKSAQFRLLLTGDLAINGVDSFENTEENQQHEITFLIDHADSDALENIASKWNCSRDEAARRVILEELKRRINPSETIETSS
ncbi:MAG: hypothetical protein KDI50_05185 [Candidatus Competibacteraceae bacterium]|nr:hypothetical protein [Candidatus Competibacteraceae bacterium]